MAITTLDGVIAGMQPPRYFSKAVTATLVAGRPASLWALGGNPGAGSFDSTLNGVTLSSSSALVNGQIPHYNPGTGNAYLARFQANATQPGTLLLLDRLWHNGGYTITSTGSSITEVTGGSYARVEIAEAGGTNPTWEAVSGGAVQNEEAITFPTASASWGTITNMVICDASSAGNLLWYGDITDQAVGSGSTVSFAIGAIDISQT